MKKLFLFLSIAGLIATVAYGLDREFRASTGDARIISDTGVVELENNGAVRLQLESDGDVVATNHLGVGISPVWDFHVHNDSAANTFIKVSNTATGSETSSGLDLGVLASGEAFVLQREALSLGLWTGEVKRVDIEADGDTIVNERLMVGGSSPVQRLSVGNATSATQEAIYIANDSGSVTIGASQGGGTLCLSDSDGAANVCAGSTLELGAGNTVRAKINSGGTFEATVRTDGNCGIGNICSGGWTPTITGISNFSSVGGNKINRFMKMGNQMLITGWHYIFPAAAGNMAYRMTLPTAAGSPNYTQPYECHGVVTFDTSSNRNSGYCQADTGSDELVIGTYDGSGSGQEIRFHCMCLTN